MEIKNSKLNALLVVLMVSLMGSSGLTHAQDASNLTFFSGKPLVQNTNNWTFAAQTMFAAPMQELKQNNYRNGGGLAFELFSPSVFNQSSFINVKFGTHVDYMRSGTEMEEIDLTAYGSDPVEYRARNQSAGMHLIGRLMTKEMLVTPYVDGFVGTRWFFSTSSVLIEEEPDCPHFETDFLTNNLTFVYGGSVGTMVKIHERAALDFRMTYSQGSSADFINLDNFQDDLNGSPITTSHRDADEANASSTTTTIPRNPGDAPEHTMNTRISTPILFFSAGMVFKIH